MRWLAIVILGIAGIASLHYAGGEPRPFVSLREAGPYAPEAAAADEHSRVPLRFALGARVTPGTSTSSYWRLIDFLEQRLGRPVQLVDRPDYGSLNDGLRAGRIDAAFVCSYPYVVGQEEFGLRLLAVPVVRGETSYFSLIIVHRDAPCRSLLDLRGRSFAYLDKLANAGYRAPRQALIELGQDPDEFFGEITRTQAQDVSIRAVARKIVDAAAVGNIVWAFLQESQPAETEHCRVIERLGPYGIPPIVTRPDLPADERQRLLAALLSMDQDPLGAAILRELRIDRFVEADDTIYDSTRRQRDLFRSQRPPR